MPSTDLTTLKAEINKRRKTITLPKIAQASGVSYQTLILLMSGKTKNISAKTEKKLNSFLGRAEGSGSAPAPARRGRPKGSKNVAETVAKKRGPKAAPAKARKITAPPVAAGMSIPLMFGKDIASEIGALQSRITYLKKIEVAQKKFWKLVGKL